MMGGRLRFAPLTTALVTALIVSQLRAQQTCIDSAAVRQAHVDVIKRAILFKLQLTEEPENPPGQIVVPRAKQEEFRAVSAAQKLVSQQRAGCAEQPEVTANYVLLQPEQILRRSGHHGVYGDFPLTSSHAQRSSTHFLRFDLNLSNKDVISSAELRLWYHVLDKEVVSPGDKQWISIYHILKQNENTYFGEDPTFFSTRTLVSLEHDGYISFNITQSIQQWIEIWDVPVGSFYLEVNVEKLQNVNENGQLVLTSPAVKVAYTDMEGQYSKTTQLVLKTHSAHKLRRKRQVGRRTDPRCTALNSRNCCKRDLVIDIQHDLDWRWVLYPRTIPINFCSGLCSLDWPTATYHTFFRIMYSMQIENPTSSPSPCCVPDKLAPLPFMIFNGSNIQIVSIEDISVESCICR